MRCKLSLVNWQLPIFPQNWLTLNLTFAQLQEGALTVSFKHGPKLLPLLSTRTTPTSEEAKSAEGGGSGRPLQVISLG